MMIVGHFDWLPIFIHHLMSILKYPHLLVRLILTNMNITVDKLLVFCLVRLEIKDNHNRVYL
jgi:hypothetical protein